MQKRKTVTVWYALQANDGMECEITWHFTKESAQVNDVEDDDDYGDITVGSVETYEGSPTHLKAK